MCVWIGKDKKMFANRKNEKSIFDAYVDSMDDGITPASQRLQSWRQHLAKLGMEKDAIFYSDGFNIKTEFPSGLVIKDNGDNVIFLGKNNSTNTSNYNPRPLYRRFED